MFAEPLAQVDWEHTLRRKCLIYGASKLPQRPEAIGAAGASFQKGDGGGSRKSCGLSVLRPRTRPGARPPAVATGPRGISGALRRARLLLGLSRWSRLSGLVLHQDFGFPASLAGLWLLLQRASLRILSPERPRGPLGSRGSGRSGVQQRLPPGACRSALSSGAWCAVGTQAHCQTNEPSLRGRLPEVLPSKPRRVSTGKPGSAPGCPLARLAPNSPQSQGRCGPATAPGLR